MIQAVRKFNRFYTRQIGVLHEHLLDSAFSLTEVRVLYEIAHRERATAAEIAKYLGLDAGYLSRILLSFDKQALIVRKPSAADGRQTHLSLSKKGERTLAALDESSDGEVASMLKKLSTADQKRVVAAMKIIEDSLSARPGERIGFHLRSHRPGDMGWVIHRHGVLYAQQYGWDERFEALVAEIAAKFLQSFDPKCERCWLAESDGEIVGSVFLVKHSDETARLRLLLVEPSARGFGLGQCLVTECIQFARQAQYKRITLWTQNILNAARHIYEKAGFQLVHEERHHSFGHDLVGQTWEMSL